MIKGVLPENGDDAFYDLLVRNGTVLLDAFRNGLSQTCELDIVSRTLLRCRVADLSSGEDAEVGADSLNLGYRTSSVGAEHLVVWAEFQLEPGEREASEAEIADIVRWRRENQPGGSNAGSVFTNPPGDSAGRLIDAAGLKGHRLGSAHVSPKHANFFQADEGGSADDVRALMQEVQRLVEERMGTRLEPELRLVGFDR